MTPVALVVPKRTAVAPVKLEPVMMTVVPPAAGPLGGLTPVTAGTPSGPTSTPITSTASMLTYVNVAAGLRCPVHAILTV